MWTMKDRNLENPIAQDDVESTIILAVWSATTTFYSIQHKYILQSKRYLLLIFYIYAVASNCPTHINNFLMHVSLKNGNW